MSFAQRLHRVLILALFSSALAGPAHAAWMWDQDQNKIDDRIQAVQTQGITAAHVGGLITGRWIIAAFDQVTPIDYGVYVGYHHHTTDDDEATLAALGVP